MRRVDGREVFVHLALPLPWQVASDLMEAVSAVAKKHGYTDVVLLTDGTSGIAAKPSAEQFKRET